MTSTEVKDPTTVTGYCKTRNHKKCGYREGGPQENGIALTGGGFYMCPCKCHDHQADAVAAKQRELQPESATARAVESDRYSAVQNEVTTVPVDDPDAVAAKAREAADEATIIAAEEEMQEHLASLQPGDDGYLPVKTVGSSRPAPQRRPEQKPGDGEFKVRIGKPVNEALRVEASYRPEPLSPVIAKFDAAHVYKDGAIIVVLNRAEAHAVKAALAGSETRSARAVVSALS
jgi:hypothetical protein